MKRSSDESLFISAAKRPRIAEILKAIGHPLRLHIIEILTGGEDCVTSIQRETGASQSSVSQQMTILRNAGLVKVRPEGTHRYYRLANSRIVDLLRCLAQCQDSCTEQ